MYFPYVRGRQYELLALRELANNRLLNNRIVPILEPVRLSTSLVILMEKFIENDYRIAIVRNPSVGSFNKEWEEAKQGTKNAKIKEQILRLYQDDHIIESLIFNQETERYFGVPFKNNFLKTESLAILVEREGLVLFGKHYNKQYPMYVLIPDESAFRRKIREHRILLDDKFEKLNRTSDYAHTPDEFYSDDHLYYRDDGYIGFSDFSVIGRGFQIAGFAPRAVAIHIIYFDDDKTLKVKHFVSDSNDDIKNPAMKYYQALQKLINWYNTSPEQVNLTLALKTFLEHFESEKYPGLGTVKKLSLMHHIEMMGRYLGKG